MNLAFVIPEGHKMEIPEEPPEGHAIPISDELFEMVMMTATFMGAINSYSTRAHKAMNDMATATLVKIEDADGHAVKTGGVTPIVATLSVISAAQHAAGVLEGLMAEAEGAN